MNGFFVGSFHSSLSTVEVRTHFLTIAKAETIGQRTSGMNDSFHLFFSYLWGGGDDGGGGAGV